jgi:two-component system sensor histidine kinase TtrS
VEALLSEVQQHPQQRRLWLEVKSWLIQHRLIMGGIGLALLLLTLNYIWVMLLVRRRGRQLNATPSGCASRSWRCKRQDR